MTQQKPSLRQRWREARWCRVCGQINRHGMLIRLTDWLVEQTIGTRWWFRAFLLAVNTDHRFHGLVFEAEADDAT